MSNEWSDVVAAFSAVDADLNARNRERKVKYAFKKKAICCNGTASK